MANPEHRYPTSFKNTTIKENILNYFLTLRCAFCDLRLFTYTMSTENLLLPTLQKGRLLIRITNVNSFERNIVSYGLKRWDKPNTHLQEEYPCSFEWNWLEIQSGQNKAISLILAPMYYIFTFHISSFTLREVSLMSYATTWFPDGDIIVKKKM